MKQNMKILFGILLIVVIAVAVKLILPEDSPVSRTQPLFVFAAAGTAPAMKEIATQFTKDTGISVQFNFANAGVLAKQINAGSDAHIFFSANAKWMDVVEKNGKIDPSTRFVLLKNELVVIVPKGNSRDASVLCAPKGSNEFKGRIALGDEATPVGIYARQSLSKFGWWDNIKDNVCFGDTVSKVLYYVALKEAAAGIVFRSVATMSDDVDIVGVIPADSHKPICFPIAAGTTPHPGSQSFLDFVKSEKASAIFEKYGWRKQ